MVMKRLFTLCAALALFSCSGDDELPMPEPECIYNADCDAEETCVDTQCVRSAGCRDVRDCETLKYCADDACFCQLGEPNYCRPFCETDLDCPSDGHCLDGVCERYPASFTGAPAPVGDSPGTLQIGLSTVDLNFPIGVSPAGYGARSGDRTPYQRSLGGTNTWFDRPDVKAVAIDDGRELAVLLRTPTSWTTDFMVTRTIEKVQERTGFDLTGQIVTTAPHSHSHPGRYWHLVNGLGFGFFGYGTFSFEIFERLTDSLATAVELALMDRQPRQFGYTVIEDFDPDRRVHRDRRSENNNLPGDEGLDDNMLLMRIDNMDGSPAAVLTNFGIHGTHFNDPIITGDAGGAVEVELQRLASERYGQPVMGIFVQGNARDVSAAGDGFGHNNFEKIQMCGRAAFQVIDDALDSITTSNSHAVKVVTGRIPISHHILGYEKGEFYEEDVRCDATVDYFRFGAFQCVEGRTVDDDPSTRFEDGDLNCVFGVECITTGHPVPQFQKTVLSVLQIGPLVLATAPGEPLSQFGRDTAKMVLEVVPDATHAAVIGYSQDHHFYLLPEEDWWQGGYEPSRDIWGWRLGPYLIENSVRIARELAKEPNQRDTGWPQIKPMYWVPIDDEEAAWVEFTETTGEPTEMFVDVPASDVERGSELEIAWAGGHPGVDQPRIVLEVAQPQGGFAPFMRPGDQPYDDSAFEMIVTYEGDCNGAQCNDHRWKVRWQESLDFPTGLYRFRVTGNAFKGGATVD